MVSSTDTIRCKRPHHVKNRACFTANVCRSGCKRLQPGMQTFASASANVIPKRSVLTGKPCVVDGLTEIGDCKAAADGGHHLEQDADEGSGLGYVDGESRRLLHHGHYCTPHLCRGLAGLQPADVAAEHLLIFNIYRKALRGVGRLPGLFFFLPHKGAAIEVLDGLGGIGQDLVSATIDIDDYLSFFIFHLRVVLLWSYPGVTQELSQRKLLAKGLLGCISLQCSPRVTNHCRAQRTACVNTKSHTDDGQEND